MLQEESNEDEFQDANRNQQTLRCPQSSARSENSVLGQMSGEGETDSALQTLQSNMNFCDDKVTEIVQQYDMFNEEQELKIQQTLKVIKSREENLIEAKDGNESLAQKLCTSQRIREEVENRESELRKVCNEFQHHCLPICLTLQNCEEIKEEILYFQNFIRQQIRELEELVKEMRVVYSREEMQVRERLQREKEEREKERERAGRVRKEKEQKIENIRAKRVLTDQKDNTLEISIKEKIAMKNSITSKLKQELNEVKIKVNTAQTKNKEVRGTKETLETKTRQLEISLQNATTEKGFWENRVLCLGNETEEARHQNQMLSEELNQAKIRATVLQSENNDFDKNLDDNNNMIIANTNQKDEKLLKQCNLKELLSEISFINEKKQENILHLQTLLQEKQCEQEALKTEYSSKIEELKEQIDVEMTRSSEMTTKKEEVQQRARQLLNKLKENKICISTMEHELALLKEDAIKRTHRMEELEPLSKDKTLQHENAAKDMGKVDESLQELQGSLADINKTQEEFVLQITRERSEAEQELKNVQRELQNTSVNQDWIIQETMTCVKECKQTYAQHVEEKNVALANCKEEFHSLSKQVEDGIIEKNTIEANLKAKKRELENQINVLTDDLKRTIANNQPRATSTPIGCLPPRSNVGLEEKRFPRSILKSSSSENLDTPKQVQFIGLASDSDSSIDIQAAIPNFFPKSSSQKISENSVGEKEQASLMSENSEIKIPKGKPPRFYKSKSHACTGSERYVDNSNKYFED